MRRRFNKKQKQLLYIFSDGKCSICGKELQRGWHGDHIKPFSKGGETIIDNGQALCPDCNLKKSNNFNHFNILSMQEQMQRKNPYAWQEDFGEKFAAAVANGRQSYLLEACVGAGKSFASLKAADRLRELGYRKFIVISPSDNKRTEWYEDFQFPFEKYKSHITPISLDPAWNGMSRWSSNYSGVSITYQQLANPVTTAVLSRFVDDYTLVIADEPHHQSEKNTWGVNFMNSFHNAGSILLLSGTPFRGDNTKIPFIKYTEEEPGIYVSKPDYSYSYSMGIRNETVCPTAFQLVSGTVEFTSGKLETSYDLTEKQISKILDGLYSSGSFVKDLLTESVCVLRRERKKVNHENDAMLVVVRSKYDVKRVEKILKELGVSYVSVVSDDPESSTTITNFKKSQTEAIIAIKMVSEGVNIPRIRVISYLSNIRTQMFLTQVMGRGVRVPRIENAVPDYCFMIMPDIAPFRQFVENVESETKHAIIELEEKIKKERELSIESGQKIIDLALNSSGGESKYISGGEEIPLGEVEYAQKVLNHSGLHEVGLMTGLKLIKSIQALKSNTGFQPAQEVTSISPFEVNKDLRDRIQTVVGKIQRITGEDFANIHVRAGKAANCPPMKANPNNEQLKRKLQSLLNWLNTIS